MRKALLAQPIRNRECVCVSQTASVTGEWRLNTHVQDVQRGLALVPDTCVPVVAWSENSHRPVQTVPASAACLNWGGC